MKLSDFVPQRQDDSADWRETLERYRNTATGSHPSELLRIIALQNEETIKQNELIIKLLEQKF